MVAFFHRLIGGRIPNGRGIDTPETTPTVILVLLVAPEAINPSLPSGTMPIININNNQSSINPSSERDSTEFSRTEGDKIYKIASGTLTAVGEILKNFKFIDPSGM
jgi:hypothetical protein